MPYFNRPTNHRPPHCNKQPEGAAACGMCLEVTKVDNMPFLTDDLTKCGRMGAWVEACVHGWMGWRDDDDDDDDASVRVHWGGSSDD